MKDKRIVSINGSKNQLEKDWKSHPVYSDDKLKAILLEMHMKASGDAWVSYLFGVYEVLYDIAYKRGKEDALKR